jgi:hypothetical protein
MIRLLKLKIFQITYGAGLAFLLGGAVSGFAANVLVDSWLTGSGAKYARTIVRNLTRSPETASRPGSLADAS